MDGMFEKYGRIIMAAVAIIFALSLFGRYSVSGLIFDTVIGFTEDFASLVSLDSVNKYEKLVSGDMINPSISYNNVQKIVFCQEKAPENISIIDLSEKKNKSIVGWTQNGTFYISTQSKKTGIELNEDCSSMFKGKENIQSIQFGNFIKADTVTNVSHMFEDCSKLTNLDLQNLHFGDVYDFSYMFSQCEALESIPAESLDVSHATSLEKMFNRCKSVQTLNVTNWNTSNVTNMASLFDMCFNLQNVDVSNFNTSNVTDMSGMFSGCTKLNNINVTNFDTSKVIDMSWMFCNMPELTELDLSNFNTHNVIAMQKMFYNDNGLVTIYANSNKWNTDKVTDTLHPGDQGVMFHNCYNLKSSTGINFSWNDTTVKMANCKTGYLTEK